MRYWWTMGKDTFPRRSACVLTKNTSRVQRLQGQMLGKTLIIILISFCQNYHRKCKMLCRSLQKTKALDGATSERSEDLGKEKNVTVQTWWERVDIIAQSLSSTLSFQSDSQPQIWITQTCKHHDIKHFPNHQIWMVYSSETVPTTPAETPEDERLVGLVEEETVQAGWEMIDIINYALSALLSYHSNS